LQWHFESCPTPAEAARKHDDANSTTTNVGSLEIQPTATKDGIGEAGSFELTDAEIQQLLVRLGFEVLETKVAPSGDTGEFALSPQPGCSCLLLKQLRAICAYIGDC